MQIIDTHVHMDSLERAALELMSLAGVKAVVADAAPMPGLAPAWQSVIDFIERTLGYDTIRGGEFFIDVYVMIGINMFFVPHDYRNIFDLIPKYMKRDRVVGIGEIGLEPRSETCPDLQKQEEIVKFFLKIAKDYDKTVLFHTPPTDRLKWVERYFKLIDDANLNTQKVIISHVDSSILKMVTDFGCIAGITVQPWRKMMPADVAKMIKNAEMDRILIDSDSSLRFGSDPLGVPKTALEMKKLGFTDDEIKKVVYENPIRIFDLK
jgi:uncharacterized protein